MLAPVIMHIDANEAMCYNPLALRKPLLSKWPPEVAVATLHNYVHAGERPIVGTRGTNGGFPDKGRLDGTSEED